MAPSAGDRYNRPDRKKGEILPTRCKLALSQVVTRPPGDLSTAWGRIFYLYGPGEYPSRLVPSVIGSLLHDEPARCTHGRQLRDYLHVADVASAFAAILDGKSRGS